MAIRDGPAVFVLRRVINRHPAQRAETGRVPEEVPVLKNALIPIFTYGGRVDELRLFEREATPLVALLGNYRVFLNR